MANTTLLVINFARLNYFWRRLLRTGSLVVKQAARLRAKESGGELLANSRQFFACSRHSLGSPGMTPVLPVSRRE
jgi:hypothetical protein